MSLVLSLSVFAGTRPAGFRGIGPRLGMTVNPDQFHFGGHIDFGDLADNLMMMPNIEIGVGDNITTVAPSFELDYRFREDWGALDSVSWRRRRTGVLLVEARHAATPNSVSICSSALAEDRLGKPVRTFLCRG